MEISIKVVVFVVLILIAAVVFSILIFGWGDEAQSMFAEFFSIFTGQKPG